MVSICKKRIVIFFFLCIIGIHAYSQENAANSSVSDVDGEVDAIESQEDQSSEYSVIDEETLVLEPGRTDATQIQTLGVWGTARIFLVLIVLLIGVVGFVYLLKRVQTSHNSTNQEVIDIVASRGGTQGSAFHVIKIGTGYVLVGVSSSSTHLIKDFTEKEDIDEITLAISKAEEQENKKTRRNNFINRLRDKLVRGHNKSFVQNYSGGSVLSLFKSRGDHI